MFTPNPVYHVLCIILKCFARYRKSRNFEDADQFILLYRRAFRITESVPIDESCY